MKKIILLLLSLILLLSLCSCTISKPNNTDNSDNTAQPSGNVSKQNTETESEQTSGDFWDLKEVSEPKIEALKVEEKTVGNTSTKVKIATTPFNYDINTIKDKLNNNKFINSNYVCGTETEESSDGEVYNDAGTQIRYKTTDSVVGVLKSDYTSDTKYFNDFYFSLIGNTDIYSNTYNVQISFNEIKPTKDVQNDIYGVLKETIGENLAEYLVYSNSGTVEEMNKEIKVGDATYVLSRYISNKENNYRIGFIIRVDKQGFVNQFVYYSDNHKPIYNDIKYKIENVFPNNKFGKTNPFSYNDFLNNYMKLGCEDEYARTYANEMTVSVTTVNDLIKTRVSVTAQKGCNNVAKLVSPETEIEYIIYEKNGIVQDVEIDIEGEGGFSSVDNKETACNKIISVEQEQIKSIIGNIDLTGLNYSDIKQGEKYSPVQKRTVSLAGKDIELSISVGAGENMLDCYGGYFKINN